MNISVKIFQNNTKTPQLFILKMSFYLKYDTNLDCLIPLQSIFTYMGHMKGKIAVSGFSKNKSAHSNSGYSVMVHFI